MRKTNAPLFLIFALAAVLASGCASRNPRPTPGSTISQGSASTQRDTSWNINDQPVGDASSELQVRDTILGNYGNNSALSTGDGSGTGAELTGMNPNAIATVYFGFDQSAIAPNERTKLQALAERMRNNPALRVLVEGHCDWRGTVEYNIALGERRAKSVVRYMNGLGVADSRFETLSKGDLEAAVEGTASQMAKDRRADVIPLR